MPPANLGGFFFVTAHIGADFPFVAPFGNLRILEC